MTLILFYLAISLFILGYAWTMTEAFKQSMVWGLASLFPPLALVFGVWHLRRQWLPTLLMVVPLLAIFGLMPLFGRI